MPSPRWDTPLRLAASAAIHVAVVLSLLAVGAPTFTRVATTAITDSSTAIDPIEVRHLVFLAPRPMHEDAGGGGGGGNNQKAPIRRAQGIGSDAITLRAVPRPVPVPSIPVTAGFGTAPEPPQLWPVMPVVIDAVPLNSGTFNQLGLPSSGVSIGSSLGPGSGGGVGTGRGTGIGSGEGPGLGPGSGGGTGGGVYRPGGKVRDPRVLVQTKPAYTDDALFRKVQGSVMLELVVTCDGQPRQIRVVRSLDPGLDARAVQAVEQWRFEPGRIGNTPVEVLVTILIDFSIY